MQPGLMPGSRLSKEEVNYRLHEKCSTCDHYYPSNSCDIIAGNISPDTVCDKWEIKSKSKYYDKEFYQGELDKQSKK